jgi:hypothetical protein
VIFKDCESGVFGLGTYFKDNVRKGVFYIAMGVPLDQFLCLKYLKTGPSEM